MVDKPAARSGADVSGREITILAVLTALIVLATVFGLIHWGDLPTEVTR